MSTSKFEVTKFNEGKYNNLWTDLNVELEMIEKESGLSAALEALQRQQYDQGFIKDDLKAVERYRLIDVSDHSHVFTAQFNPRRALRFAGAGRTSPPPNANVVNNGCFLCRENVRWQQRGIEIGYEISVREKKADYTAWMNPFPLMPTHATIAKTDHIPQTWVGNSHDDQGRRISDILNDFLELTGRLPGFVGFYNGEGAGATIPAHFHFQFFKRPEGQEFALERAANIVMAEVHQARPLVIRKYPIKTIYFFGSQQEIAQQAGRWVQQWTKFYESDQALSANIIAMADRSGKKGMFHLFFVPRNRFYSHAPGIAGLVGGLEVLGELVFCTEEEKQRLVSGQVDYSSVVRILSSVEAPGVVEFLDTIPA